MGTGYVKEVATKGESHPTGDRGWVTPEGVGSCDVSSTKQRIRAGCDGVCTTRTVSVTVGNQDGMWEYECVHWYPVSEGERPRVKVVDISLC